MKNQIAKSLLGGIALSAFLSVSSIASDSGNWLNWRGPNHNGVAESGQNPPIEFSENKNLKWKAAVPGRGHSSPIVVGDRVFLTTARENEGTQSVLCYSFDSGELLWENIVLEGMLPAQIHRKNTHASPSVVSDGERIFAVFFVKGDRLRLFSMDLDGNELWQVDVGRFYPEERFGYGTSPLIAAGNVIVAAESQGDGYIASYDIKTGKEVWRTVRVATRSSHGTHVLAEIQGTEQVLLNGADRVAAYDPSSGREIWSVEGGDPLIANSVVWKDDVVFASGGYPGRETWAVDVKAGKAKWTTQVKCYEQSMVVVGDYLYGVAERGVVHCWDAENGEVLWRDRLPKEPESASLIYAGGHLYHANEAGQIFVIKPDPGKMELVAENQLGEEIFATPAICRDTILIRSAKYDEETRSETLYAIGF